MKTKLFSRKKIRGMTLVEIMLALVILGILSIVAITSLFFPRYLIETSASKRTAVDAGTSLIEQSFATSYELVAEGEYVADLSSAYNINGRTVSATTTVQRVTEVVYGNSCEYLLIHTEVSFPNAESPVVLETYRSPME